LNLSNQTPPQLLLLHIETADELRKRSIPYALSNSGGHSAFPNQRMAQFWARFQNVENPLLCPWGAKGAELAGKVGNVLR